jgi:hypothetical protein
MTKENTIKVKIMERRIYLKIEKLQIFGILLSIEICKINELELVLRGYTANTEKPKIVMVAHLRFWQSILHPRRIFKYVKQIVKKVKDYEEFTKRQIIKDLIKSVE